MAGPRVRTHFISMVVMVSANLILIFLALILGLLLRLSGRLPQNAATSFNAFVIWISVPAIILVQIPKLLTSSPLSWDLLIPISMPWLMFALSFFLFTWLGQKFSWSRAETGALVLTAGLANTSFVGIPLLDSILGPQSTPLVLIVDQLGSFLTLSFLGVFYASSYSPNQGSKVELKKILKTIVSFPPFIALWVAAVFWLVDFQWNPMFESVLEKLGMTLVPLALIAVGYQLRLSPRTISVRKTQLALGLTYKLLLAPFIFLILYTFILGSKSFSTHVTLLESAMAPMITAGVVAEEFGFETEISSLMIGLGIPISLVTVLAWDWIFRLVGFS